MSRFLQMTFNVEVEVPDDTPETDVDHYVSSATNLIKGAMPGAVDVDLMDWDLGPVRP